MYDNNKGEGKEKFGDFIGEMTITTHWFRVLSQAEMLGLITAAVVIVGIVLNQCSINKMGTELRTEIKSVDTGLKAEIKSNTDAIKTVESKIDTLLGFLIGSAAKDLNIKPPVVETPVEPVAPNKVVQPEGDGSQN